MADWRRHLYLSRGRHIDRGGLWRCRDGSGPSCLRRRRWLQPWHTELQENAWPRSIQVSCRFNAHTCPRVPVSATLIRTEFEGDEPVCCGQGAAVFEHGDHFAWRDRAELMVAHASFPRHLCAANGMAHLAPAF